MELYSDQQAAFNQIESETLPVFVTGQAGTGKSQLLRYLRDHGKASNRTEVVAFTGTAAVNVDGRTIHNLILNSRAWSQSIQIFAPLRENRELKKSSIQDLAFLEVLIIDEISMVRADMIDALDRAFRLAKGNSKPFGGVRIVMFGDLRQLPPFIPERDLLHREARFLSGYVAPQEPYFFMAHVFALTPISLVELTIQKRVVGDDSQRFIDALNGLRNVPPKQQALEFINENSNSQIQSNSTFLFSRRKNAHHHNLAKLFALPGETKSYLAKFRRFEQEELEDDFSDKTAAEFPAPRRLDLRLGARVMVVANLDVSAGLVNGALGTVVNMHDDAVSVELDRTGETHLLRPHAFDWKGLAVDFDRIHGETVEQSRLPRRTKIIGSFLQVPLILAWGVTIHKAQGATLDQVSIDFRAPYFSPGQAYVALSRLTSISGLSRAGTLGVDHFPPYSKHVEAFESKSTVTPLKKSLAEEAERTAPWREFGEILSLLDNYLELIPQVTDYDGFSHRKRMQYLRDQGLQSPSAYLQHFYAKDPESALILYRNIDRALRNKPMILSAEVLGDSKEAALRLQYELTGDDQWRLFLRFGDMWTDEAKKLLGQGQDVATDVIPEYEIDDIEFVSAKESWSVRFVKNPAAKERLWEFLRPQRDGSVERTKYPTLGLLLMHRRIEWTSRSWITCSIQGSLDESRALDFLPYLGVDSANTETLSLNGLSLDFDQPLETVMPDEVDWFSDSYDVRDYPSERFKSGERVLLTIGVHSGKPGTILFIEEIDFVQYLIVKPDQFPDPITVRGHYAKRL
jgi:hypothetical protein